MASWPALRSTLTGRGFVARPARGDAALDQGVAEAMFWPACGREGMAFTGFFHRTVDPCRGGYVAVAHCSRCDTALEF